MWSRSNSSKSFSMKKRFASFQRNESFRSVALFLGSCFSFSQRSRMKNIQFFSSGRASLVKYCLFNNRSRSMVFLKLSRFSFHVHAKNKSLSSIKVVGF